SVTSPIDGTNFAAGTGPSSPFKGNAADNTGGAGLNANSTTFTLQRGTDGLYWNGSGFSSATAVNLSTTNVGTTCVNPAWCSNVTLPAWSTQSAGDYFVQATATDAAGNVFTGPVATFRILGKVSPTSLGTAGTNQDTATILLSPTFSGMSVGIGRTLIVTIAVDPIASTVSVSDGANTYTKDADISNGSGTPGVRTLIFSAPVTTALNGRITITSSPNLAAPNAAV